MPEVRLLTVAEVADLFQVEAQTVRRWIRQGRLAAHCLGGNAGYRIQRPDVQALLAATKGGTRLRQNVGRRTGLTGASRGPPWQNQRSRFRPASRVRGGNSSIQNGC